MDTSIFRYGELPEFKKFTPENIGNQFPVVLEKLEEDFQKIEKTLWLPLNQKRIQNSKLSKMLVKNYEKFLLN